MKRTECGGCQGKDLSLVLDLGGTPLADQFPATPEEAAAQTRYPLKLLVCYECKLVQLEEIVDDYVLFGSDYGFYSGTSEAILEYYDRYADWMWIRFNGDSSLKILEIACNDGGLLSSLREKGFTHLEGVDPASGPAKAAQDKGFPVSTEHFGSGWNSFGDKYDVVIANHVVAHTSNLTEFLLGIHDALNSKGRAVIEFQYLPDLLVGNMFDHVYHEHRFFFSISSFRKAALRAGLFLESSQWIDRQGGSMRVVLTKGQPQFPQPPCHKEEWINSWDPYESMQGRAEHIKDRLLNLINPARGVLAGYGAPAKATTLLNFCGLSKRELEWVVDTTPVKQGKFMPGTNIPIIHPDAEMQGLPHRYLLLTWNYVGEIIHKETKFLENGGRFIVPIPYPTVI